MYILEIVSPKRKEPEGLVGCRMKPLLSLVVAIVSGCILCKIAFAFLTGKCIFFWTQIVGNGHCIFPW